MPSAALTRSLGLLWRRRRAANCRMEKMMEDLVPSYAVRTESLVTMQQRNHALKLLQRNIDQKVSPKKWKEKPLNQFKRSAGQLRFKGKLLVKWYGKLSPVVVSLPYMVEIIYKTHPALNHIGRHKLVDAIRPQFWHPGLDGICLDF